MFSLTKSIFAISEKIKSYFNSTTALNKNIYIDYNLDDINANHSISLAPLFSILVTTLIVYETSHRKYLSVAYSLTLGLSEILIKNKLNVDHMHILSRTFINHNLIAAPFINKLITKYPANNAILNGLKFSASVAIALTTRNFINFKEVIDQPINSLEFISKIFFEQELKQIDLNDLANIKNAGKFLHAVAKLLLNPLVLNLLIFNLVTSVKSFVSHKLMLKISEYNINDSANFIVTFLKGATQQHTNQDAQINELKPILFDIAKVFLINSLYSSFSDVMAVSRGKIINQKTNELLFNNNAISKLLNIDPTCGKDIILNIQSDLSIIVSSIDKFSHIFTTFNQIFISLRIIKESKTLEYISLYFANKLVYGGVTDILKKLNSDSSLAKTKIDGLEYRLVSSSIENHRIYNIENNDKSSNFFLNRFTELNNQNNYITLSKIIPFSVILNIIYSLDFFCGVYISKRIFYNENKVIKIEDLAKILKVQNDFSKIFYYSKVFEFHNIKLKISLSRINKFFSSINSKDVNHQNQYIDEDAIIFENYRLNKVNENSEIENLVKIPHFKITPGKYLIKGESGKGKSSIFKNLITPNYGLLQSEGIVKQPKDSKILYVGNKLFLITDLSLFESMIYPVRLAELTAEKIMYLKDLTMSLLLRVGIKCGEKEFESQVDILDLDKEITSLSTGESQRCNFVGSIIKNILEPKLLIIYDESFSNIDIEKRITCRRLIDEYYINKIIVEIDHHVINDEFYNAEFKLENCQLSELRNDHHTNCELFGENNSND